MAETDLEVKGISIYWYLVMSSFIGQDQFEKIKYKKKLKIYKHKELKPKFHAIRQALTTFKILIVPINHEMHSQSCFCAMITCLSLHHFCWDVTKSGKRGAGEWKK